MIDLFAGCGGMTAGFKPHGFEPVLSVEWNLHAAATYAANYGESHTFWGDIDDALEGEIPEADVVIGGPPCQGFSNPVISCGSDTCRSSSGRTRKSSSSRTSSGSDEAQSSSFCSMKPMAECSEVTSCRTACCSRPITAWPNAGRER
jgi:hypothetical protein